MSKPRFTTQQMAAAGIIAAIYAALTLLLPIPQYGGIQFRVAEAMTVLPFLFPEAIPGLTVGCFLANLLGSPIPLDWIVGTAATLLAALWTSKLHHRALAPLPPVICNMVLVGAEIAWFSTQEGAAFWPAFAFNTSVRWAQTIDKFPSCFIISPCSHNMQPNHDRTAKVCSRIMLSDIDRTVVPIQIAFNALLHSAFIPGQFFTNRLQNT